MHVTPQVSINVRRLSLVLAIATATILSSVKLGPIVFSANANATKPSDGSARVLLTRMEFPKRIPRNATATGYTEDMAASDAALAAIFGGPGAVAAANGFEPRHLGRQYPLYRGDLVSDDGRILRGHLSFAMHLYGSEDGTDDTYLYVPAGFASHSTTPTPTDAVVTFYYPKLGNLTDITLAVFHVANFQLGLEGTRVRIGSIGGPGGSIGTYKHSHLEFYKGLTGLPSAAARERLRIDPVSVFGSSTKIALRRRRVGLV